MCERITGSKELTHDTLTEMGYELFPGPVRKRSFLCRPDQQLDSTPQHAGDWPFVELTGLCLVGADFSDLNLNFARFTHCDLSSAKFDRCNLFKAVFKNCILYNARFDKAVLTDIIFTDSKLFGIRLGGAEIHGLGDQEIARLIKRERWPESGALAFRGTAGFKEWAMVCCNHGNLRDKGFFGRDSHRILPDDEIRSKDAEGNSMLIPGPGFSEIIEVAPLYSKRLRTRATELKKQKENEENNEEKGTIPLPMNFPRPPGDAFPEDSTGMTLRGFRKCFERQGNKYPASIFRFWETTYLTASQWRIIQSKLTLSATNETFSFLRRLLALIPAFVAWTLLNKDDERRDDGWFGRQPRKTGKTDESSPSKEKEDKSRWPKAFSGEGGSGFVLHLGMLFLYLAAALSGFYFQFSGGIVSILCVAIFTFVFAPFAMAVGMMSSWSSFCREFRDAVLDICRAMAEFSQHTLCGHGECPHRAMIGVGIWVALFGAIFSIQPECLSYNNGAEEIGSSLLRGFYYSVVSATTLGFGDIAPGTPHIARLVCIEVLGAIVMTGVFIASLTRRFIDN